MQPAKSNEESSGKSVVIWDVTPRTAARMSVNEKRKLAVEMLAGGLKAPEIAGKLGVSQQRVHQYRYEAQGKSIRAKKEPGTAVVRHHSGNSHRLAQKVRRQAAALLIHEDSDFLLDVLLLCREITRDPS